jgi:hypothetical protein
MQANKGNFLKPILRKEFTRRLVLKGVLADYKISFNIIKTK